MPDLWLFLLVFMLATWIVLDGFDLGAGILHLPVARGDAERREVLASVGPVWDGNEVWLIAAGGTMLMAFPGLTGPVLAGFYLPVMIVLWLLVFRALGIEMRHQLHDPLWCQFWDAAFAASSLLLAVITGAALANVFRGVPMADGGTFFEPLWTDFRVGAATGILDWYTILLGVTAAAALAFHGALWLAARTRGAVAARARLSALRLWPAVAAMSVMAAVASVAVQPLARSALTSRPALLLIPALGAGALVSAVLLCRAGRPMKAFVASSAYLYACIGGGAACLHPFVLPARDPARSLTAAAVAAPQETLEAALAWWIPGMLIVAGYFAFSYGRLRPA
jgi:cytochrome d ubiquinol oxidase subunit II